MRRVGQLELNLSVVDPDPVSVVGGFPLAVIGIGAKIGFGKVSNRVAFCIIYRKQTFGIAAQIICHDIKSKDVI